MSGSDGCVEEGTSQGLSYSGGGSLVCVYWVGLTMESERHSWRNINLGVLCGAVPGLKLLDP